MAAQCWVSCAVMAACALFLLLYSSGDMDDISCLFESDGHDVPFAPRPGPAIFFIETSCARGRPPLSARQACAVESAARAHPAHRVHVLLTSPVAASRVRLLASEPMKAEPAEAALTALLGYGNVHMARVGLPHYAVGSPLEGWLSTAALNVSRYRMSHASDALRYLTLWKFPGIYLDLDVVVVKPLDTLSANWAGRESAHAIAAGALSFSADEDGRRIAAAALRELRASWDGTLWGHNGPGVMTRVLRRHCRTHHVTLMTQSRCAGFAVYAERFLYPVGWREWRTYTVARETVRLLNRSAHVHHMWNKLSSGVLLLKHSGAPYTELAKHYCPKVFASVPLLF